LRELFIGSEALTRGALNRHQLRTRYRAVFPNVYLPKQIQPSLDQRTVAAWLWSQRRGIITGAAAAAPHGANWIDDDAPVELIYANSRAPRGILTRRDALLANEVQIFAGRVVTTPERTAFDIGRRASSRAAVTQLDALARATGFEVDDVTRIAARGYFSSRLVCQGHRRRFQYWVWMAFRSLTLTWAGRRAWSRSNMTETNIG
jgi:hypothetical protein